MSENNQNLAHIDEEALAFDSRKRLFLGLITLASFLLVGILVLLWYTPYYGLTNMHPVVPWIFGGVIGLLILGVIWAFWGLVLNIVFRKPMLGSNRIRGLTIKLFLPLMTLLGRIFGISKRSVRASFIKVNNELVLSELDRYPPEKILLLMPHCLQMSRCEMRLTYDITNCKRCGKCPIKGLLELSEKYGVHLAIATGGTIARRIVVQKRPRLIVAVACERDLASGIQDTYPLPVFGIYNTRPHGPCLDTQVNLDDVEVALERFLEEKSFRMAQERWEQGKQERKERRRKNSGKAQAAAPGHNGDQPPLDRESSAPLATPGESSSRESSATTVGEGTSPSGTRGEGEIGASRS